MLYFSGGFSHSFCVVSWEIVLINPILELHYMNLKNKKTKKTKTKTKKKTHNAVMFLA